MADLATSDTAAAPAISRQEQQARDLARAKEAGWTNLTSSLDGTGNVGTAVEHENHDAAPWLSDAAIYQWDDDFGEVGEPNPELEKMLFHDQFLQRAGNAIKALSFEVTVQGPNKINPVRNVSHLFLLLFTALLRDIVRRCRLASCHAGKCQAVPIQCADPDSIILYPRNLDWQ